MTADAPFDHSLPPPVAAALQRYRTSLFERFGPRLEELVLFGSHARGDAHEESDVDVLVVVEGLTERERVEVIELACHADAADREAWVGLSPLAYSSEQAAELRARERLLMRDIEREGIPV